MTPTQAKIKEIKEAARNRIPPAPPKPRPVAPRKKPAPKITDCKHRGETPERSEQCQSCRGKVEIKVFPCNVFGECTIWKNLSPVACCHGCSAFEPR